MIGEVISKASLLASAGFYSGGVGSVLADWQQAGVFDYVLPFLLVFSIVFVILSSLKIFGGNNKGFSGIIAISVALMSLQFDFVPMFFSIIFPRMGIALAIILAVIILLGLFSPDKAWMSYIYLGIGAVLLITVLVSSGAALGNQVSFWVQDNWQVLFWGIVIIVIVAVMFAPQSGEDSTTTPLGRAFNALANGSE